MPTSQLPILLNPPMRSHLLRLFQQPLPKTQQSLFSTFLEDLSPPSPTDTGLLPAPVKPRDTRPRTDEFLDFMTSPINNAEAPRGVEDSDMEWPLSSYFINSSHNTYLTGNQLYSEASAEVYRNVSQLFNCNRASHLCLFIPQI